MKKVKKKNKKEWTFHHNHQKKKKKSFNNDKKLWRKVPLLYTSLSLRKKKKIYNSFINSIIKYYKQENYIDFKI